MKTLFVIACLVASGVLVACGAPATAQPPNITPTPTACATTVPVSVATPPAAQPTQVVGRTTPTTPLPFLPTLSPAAEATQLARMQQANPGAPTTAVNAPQTSSLPPCATPTPAR